MDRPSDTDHLPFSTVLSRAARFFGYLIACMACMWLIGLTPTVAVFVVLFMRIEGNERWKLVIPYAAVLPDRHLGGVRPVHVDPLAAVTAGRLDSRR